MNPYKVLGVTVYATAKEIKAAYRQLSTRYHPDMESGNREKFEEIKVAYDILIDPERRARYDKTGRTDPSIVTVERVNLMIDQAIKNIVQAVRPDGTSDDPTWENIKDKAILSLAQSRVHLGHQRVPLERMLQRAEVLLQRFKSLGDQDPVGDALRKERKRLQDELNYNSDAVELSLEVERVLKTYSYEVGPGPEGQFSPGPTRRLRGPAVYVNSSS